MMLKVNLHGEAFKHNIVNNLISSTANKSPSNIEFVTDGSGLINLFVDTAILDYKLIQTDKPSFGWLLESNCIHPELVKFFKKNLNYLNNFEKVFTHNRELISLHNKFQFMFPTGYWVDENTDLKKTKLISMIASTKKNTKGQKIRNKVAKKYKNKVDIFGVGRNFIDKKEFGLSSYCFSIVVENDFTDDYFSEKLLDCFALRTVPIYLGSKNIGKYFDVDGIISLQDFNFKNISFDLYAKKFYSIENNFEEVKKYYIPEDLIYKKYFKKYDI